MKIDLKGRVNNINLRASHCLWPLYEAIMNSLQALEERENLSAGFVNISIIRDESSMLKFEDKKSEDKSNSPVTGFEIKDNGIGFTHSNFNSFNTSDTTYKFTKGGKGIGRFLWLKAFESVNIESIFLKKSQKEFFKRDFCFSIDENGSSNDKTYKIKAQDCQTIVKLLDFKTIYQDNCPKKIETIGEKIISHFLSYFVLKSLPGITLTDGDKTIDLKDLFEQEVHKYTKNEKFTLKNQQFDVIHTRRYSPQERKHLIYYCAIDREVTAENLQLHIPDLKKKICDSEGNEFFYIMYVTGKYLDQRVNSERTDFNILKGEEEALFSENEITLKGLSEKVSQYASRYLEPFLAPIRNEKIQQIEDFIHNNPRFRPLLKDKDALIQTIPPGLSDKKMEIELFKQFRNLEQQTMKESQEYIDTDLKSIKNLDEYHEKRDRCYKKVNDFGKANLAHYITHRRVMLELLEKSLKWDQTEKYEYEKIIHNMIIPLKTTSDDMSFDEQNLWIIDEKLAYHKYLASDLPLSKMEPLENESRQRPNVIIFNEPVAFVADDPPFQSIVIIEFKRPGRAGYSNDQNPIRQVWDYTYLIRKGKKKTKSGRPILIQENVPFYCYIVCDITEEIEGHVRHAGCLTPSPDRMGYFGYNEHFCAYTEVMSYEKLLIDAKKRNKVLFDYLFQTST